MEQKHSDEREKRMCPIHYGRKTGKKERGTKRLREGERQRHGTATWKETERAIDDMESN